jgi:predicted phosphate transport protein (TIGR00153 family)
MLRLGPKNDVFFDLLEQEVDNLQRGAKSFVELMENYTEVEAKFDAIQDIEHKGDAITRQIMEKLNSTFVTPIEREDISALAFTLDEILDIITGVADRCVLYRIGKPTPEMIALSKAMEGACAELDKLIHMLRELKYDRIIDLTKSVKKWEMESDQIYRRAVAKLLNDETLNPIYVIKWKEIYEKLEDGVDFCEDVSNLVEGVVLKNA